MPEHNPLLFQIGLETKRLSMAYQLHLLGWHNFQRLCLSIAREVLGQTVTSFLDSNDGGRDGGFIGEWKPHNGERVCGHFVVQCKHTSKLDHVLRFSDLQPEIGKAQELVSRGICDVYVRMTNGGVSGRMEAKLRSEFSRVGVRHFLCFGNQWVCEQILEHKVLRMAVPRLYGLGDLSQILDDRAYDQAKALLASLQEDLSKVVLTSTYHRAADALRQHGFVLLLGEPASGKTTIAATLAMASIDLWGCSTLKLDEPAKVVEHWNPNEPSQFFWIDDAFGATQYESWLAYRWNGAFPQVQAALKRGAKIIMTSRDYIYNRARHDLKMSTFPLLKESQVVIDVKDLELLEKQQILYNHIKLGNQPFEIRALLKPHLDSIANNPKFVPEVARRLGHSTFTAGIEMNRSCLTNFVEQREAHLVEVIAGLDADSKAAIGLIYMRDGKLGSPIVLSPSERDALDRFGSSLGGCTRAIEALKDSFVRFVVLDGVPCWILKHPTLADAFAVYLVQSHELMGIYLQGAPLDKLLHQVTSGDVGVEHAIIVPSGLQDIVLNRMSKMPHTSKNIDHINWFLTHRCSREFISLYLQSNPEVLDRVAEPGLYLSSVSETRLALRLHELGLLPEEHRQLFVKTVVQYAIEGEDGYIFQNNEMRAVLTLAENEELVRRARSELLPNLGEVRRNWQSNCGSTDDPDQFMSEFFELIEALKREFPEDGGVQSEVNSERDAANEWISEHEPPERNIPPRSILSAKEEPLSDHQTRSIFDDVDS